MIRRRHDDNMDCSSSNSSRSSSSNSSSSIIIMMMDNNDNDKSDVDDDDDDNYYNDDDDNNDDDDDNSSTDASSKCLLEHTRTDSRTERERQTDRQTDRDRDRQTDRQTESIVLKETCRTYNHFIIQHANIHRTFTTLTYLTRYSLQGMLRSTTIGQLSERQHPLSSLDRRLWPLQRLRGRRGVGCVGVGGGGYHEGRRSSSDDSFHSPTVIPPSALNKPSIIKRYHRQRTTR